MSSPPATSPKTAESKSKRARPTKSCLECRRKKLKCDRTQPCMQCKKLGREALCTYAFGPGTPAGEGAENGERMVKRPRVEVSNLASWGNGEQVIPSQVRSNEHLTQDPLAVRERTVAGERKSPAPSGKVYIQGSRSKYVGLGNQRALLDHFADEKSFLYASFRDSEVAATMTEISKYHSILNPKIRSVGQYSLSEAMFSQMLQALPDNSTINSLARKYTSNLENVLRVVHIPEYTKVCWEITIMRQNPTSRRPAHISEATLAQLLATLTISSRLSDTSEAGVQQLPEALISQYLELVKCWLEGLKGKQRITLPVIRVETLLLIANMYKMKPLPQLWKDSGSLVRVGMVMGLHRDPESIVGMSLFEKEQRRKIWQTIVELDLQFSLAIGLPPAIQSTDFSLKPLLNIDDEDLTEGMIEYPNPQPQSIWTDALPQIILASSLNERLDTANILARNIDIDNDAEDILSRAKSLEQNHQALQGTLPPRTKPRHTLFSNILLDVFIRRYSLALYRTVTLSEQGSNFLETRKGNLRGCVAILSHLDALDPAVADLDTIKSKNYLNVFHILCKNDINQAALLLCYEIRSFRTPGREQSSIHDESTPWTKHSLTRIVENTLNGYLQRIGEFGSDLKVILPLSIVLHSVRSDGTSEGQRRLMIQGIERVLLACRKAVPDARVSWDYSPHPSNAHTPNSQMLSTPSMQETTNNVGSHLMPQHYADGSLPLDDMSVDSLQFQKFDFGLLDWDFGQSWS
ncbi:Zn2/Cys6 DNA-binding protein [Glarea lozoyensis ATCC 20868]|uniref:Zn2/Cys6 DNA-binding protein n=1 Tax=Glarea lozoyensis (strain ATCC 20868 / MF5171) TaxID=1116229 RepID=S3DXE9_GLAL2|nr:Zn2/Cys6 DNA-binding protein [Glarea lozoyensis ATCC 20868]EPE31043.1 Zn2/Cys6 DNA-binding protein [Glarea lozoyensis ATCC 20868]